MKSFLWFYEIFGMGSTQHNQNNNAVYDKASIEKISMLEMSADGTSAALLMFFSSRDFQWNLFSNAAKKRCRTSEVKFHRIYGWFHHPRSSITQLQFKSTHLHSASLAFVYLLCLLCCMLYILHFILCSQTIVTVTEGFMRDLGPNCLFVHTRYFYSEIVWLVVYGT